METASGVLVINKPPGMTSHDVVNRVRRIFGQRKVGHAGTLDPDATGVLVLCLGSATRLLEYLTADDKAYDAQVVFGKATDTDDASGKVIAEADASALSRSDVENTLREFIGTTSQKVPAYSSVHIQGQRAYDLARTGQKFTLPERQVTIHSLQLHEFTSGSVAVGRFDVVCTKGTYIRSLCRDLGVKLGIPAHMGRLIRTRSGAFRLEDAVELTDLEMSADPAGALSSASSRLTLPHVAVSEHEAVRLATGQRIWVDESNDMDEGNAANETGSIVSTFYNAELVAVSRIMERQSGKWLLQPTKVFWKKDR